MSEWRRFLHASKSQSKLTMTLPLDYIQKKSAMALCLPEQRTAMETLDKLIDEATSDYATAENWPLIIAVVDKLNAVLDDEVRDEAARMVRMRLANPSTTVVLAALHLVEAIVKNCGKGMRQRIAKPKLMHTLEMLYKEHANKRGRDSLEIQARTLELVQAWGEAFLPFRRDFAGFVDTYHKMRIQGVHFPTQYDTTRAPVLSPPRGHEDNPFAFAADQVEDEPAPSAYKNLPPEDTYHVTKNIMDMMDDMLHECSKTNYATLHSNDILQDLAVQLKQLEKRLVVVIEQEANRNGAHLEKYLSLNDEVQQAMLHFKEACGIAVKQVTSPPSSRKHKQDDAMHDNDLVKEGVLSPRKAAKSTFADDRSTPKKPATTDDNDDDDDPFAAFAKERVQKLSAVAGAAAPSVGPLISFDDEAPVVAKTSVPETTKDDAPLIFGTMI
ncbi:hypothetical protein SPRG_20478 [Saprolegnia parasitica CBS 223.65]|uniref:VHS domain-containing protein n=1 Tax=Saprolegnia parasitica (strain CBS 223.65) TaxID=695850 RepID=A0A067C7H1_SAPPC|nr:hypothetical protein SPRG_20478 [Saprolegnia parasitica CBS 223.65]KDO26674.1 hypothetical protein SPRG_20478 [Saprolegnia parasitica CBS 223.65]|eukprot:XP_012202572.1 hypothetical protein SPRG_20478 [Saprolegnia parasitica CBS 223.65]